MRRVLYSFLLLLLVVSPLFADAWKKAYFGATPAGSWARYAETTPQMKMTTTMTRLEDEEGSARIELRMEFAENQYPPVQNRYTLKKGFPLDRKLIDYMTEISGGAVVSGDTEPTVLDEVTIAAIVKSAAKYEPTAKFKGTETVEGRKADRYSYTIRYESPNESVPSTTETGDLWLSASVPFGVVKQSAVTKDDQGNVTMTYERVLVASGTSAEKAEKGSTTGGR
jgi:hypothetical protein